MAKVHSKEVFAMKLPTSSTSLPYLGAKAICHTNIPTEPSQISKIINSLQVGSIVYVEFVPRQPNVSHKFKVVLDPDGPSKTLIGCDDVDTSCYLMHPRLESIFRMTYLSTDREHLLLCNTDFRKPVCCPGCSCHHQWPNWPNLP